MIDLKRKLVVTATAKNLNLFRYNFDVTCFLLRVLGTSLSDNNIALALKLLPIDMPFIDQMFYTCLITMAIIVMVSLCTCENEDDAKGIPLTASMFQTKRDFHIAAYAICVLLVVIYTIFW